MLEIINIIKEHKRAVIAVIVMIACIFISSAVAKGFTKSRNTAQRSLSDVQNRVEDVQGQLNQEVVKYRELDLFKPDGTGCNYVQSVVDKDMELLIGQGTGSVGTRNEWISAFLSWNNGEEYCQNREWFETALGSTSNDFLMNIMRPYDAGLTAMDGNKPVSSNDIRCKLLNTEFYVDAIDNDGTYHYVIRAYFDASMAYANKMYDATDKVSCYIILAAVEHSREDGTPHVRQDSWVVVGGPSDTNVYK